RPECSPACSPNGTESGRCPSATPTTGSPSTGTSSRRWRSARRCWTTTASTVTSPAAPAPTCCCWRRFSTPWGRGWRGTTRWAGSGPAPRRPGRCGVDEPGVATLEWLVRTHLALAETATRRDLSEEATITRFGHLVGTSDRLDLLYALTVGDSRATGPAAW